MTMEYTDAFKRREESTGDYYDMDGKPMTMKKWIVEFSRRDKNGGFLKQETVGTYWLSTVWLGINYGSAEEPLIFESMIFNGKHGCGSQRYSTKEEALAGHEAMKADILAGKLPTEEEL